MTTFPDRQEVLTTWRKRLFIIWVAAAVATGFAAMIGGPLTSQDALAGKSVIAMLSPLAMFVFVVSGVAWLAALVMSHRSKYTHQPPD